MYGSDDVSRVAAAGGARAGRCCWDDERGSMARMGPREAEEGELSIRWLLSSDAGAVSKDVCVYGVWRPARGLIALTRACSRAPW